MKLYLITVRGQVGGDRRDALMSFKTRAAAKRFISLLDSEDARNMTIRGPVTFPDDVPLVEADYPIGHRVRAQILARKPDLLLKHVYARINRRKTVVVRADMPLQPGEIVELEVYKHFLIPLDKVYLADGGYMDIPATLLQKCAYQIVGRTGEVTSLPDEVAEDIEDREVIASRLCQWRQEFTQLAQQLKDDGNPYVDHVDTVLNDIRRSLKRLKHSHFQWLEGQPE